MALLEFRSPASGAFFMMPETFKTICEVLGREYVGSGCWLPEDMPAMIKRLEEEVERERIKLEDAKRRREEREKASWPMSFEQEEELKKQKELEAQRVSFGMRVYPLVEMMHAAVKKEKKLMWVSPFCFKDARRSG